MPRHKPCNNNIILKTKILNAEGWGRVTVSRISSGGNKNDNELYPVYLYIKFEVCVCVSVCLSEGSSSRLPRVRRTSNFELREKFDFSNPNSKFAHACILGT